MRARLRYSFVSPRAPRRYTGYIVGLLLAACVPFVLLVLGYTATAGAHAAFGALALAAGA